MRKVLKTWMVLGLLLLSVAGLVAQDTSPTDDERCLDKDGFINEDGNCQVSGGVTFTIQYPSDFVLQDAFIEQTVDDYIDLQKSSIFQQFVDINYATPSGNPWELYLDYETFAFSEDVVSIKFAGYQYTGGAHGQPYIRTFTFDLSGDTPRILTLNDLLQEEFNPWLTIQPMVRDQLVEQFGENADVTWIDQGTGEDPNNYASFAIDGDAIVFYFQAYQVAPYVAGMPSVRIPLADINSLLKPPFLEMGS
ncbi:MAG: DUF3298 and DUF4163 domain-containing protein [Anaerolineae bacterium]|nr:DUF3298 and DUF4163 domain-containing protein [Anaerolineae bacterium]